MAIPFTIQTFKRLIIGNCVSFLIFHICPHANYLMLCKVVYMNNIHRKRNAQ